MEKLKKKKLRRLKFPKLIDGQTPNAIYMMGNWLFALVIDESCVWVYEWNGISESYSDVNIYPRITKELWKNSQ